VVVTMLQVTDYDYDNPEDVTRKLPKK